MAIAKKSANFSFFLFQLVPPRKNISGDRNINEAKCWPQCATFVCLNGYFPDGEKVDIPLLGIFLQIVGWQSW